MGCAQSQNVQLTLNLSKPYIYFVSGGPGSGKGTQCDMLVRDYRFKHLSVGDLLRQEQKKGGPLGQQLKSLMEQGKLVSSEMVVKLIKKNLARHGNRRYLIDGFPRNIENIEKFFELLKDQVVIKSLIFFNCSNEQMTRRILKRAESSGRVDDNPQTIKSRISTYQRQSLPVIQKLRNQDKVIEVNAQNSKDDIYNELKLKLSQISVLPPNPAQVIFVLGGPGSGKGTQCEILVKQYGFRHLSTGDLLRESVKNGSQKGKQIQACMKDGKLVSSQLLVGLIEENMERYNFSGRYLLDGFPRGQDNIDAWKKILDKWTNLKGILYFKCQQSQLIKRLLDRGKTSGRVDDNEETIKKRLAVFNNETNPVIETYSKEGKVIQINAMRSIQQIAENVRQQLTKIGIFPKQKNSKNPKVLCVLGGPGSGKGTQCDYLKKQFGFKHLSTGDLLREQQKNNGLYAQLIDQYIKEGRLVPSQILVLLIKKKLMNFSSNDIFLLDGFPRNQQNIDKWEQIMGVDLEFSNVLYFQCSEKVMEERLMNRGKTSGRSDDNADTIKKRLNVFQNESVPVVKKLSKKDKFVVTVSAEDTPDQVFINLKAKLLELGYKTI